MKINSILDRIGKTPVLKINHLFPNLAKRDVEVWMKLEMTNPGSSIKDRIALRMIEDAEKNGNLKQGATIIEPTSGNTGIGLALIAAVKKYPLIIVMPESMSMERRRILSMYGAKLELTPREKGMSGAIERARELCREISGSWMPMQFENESNPKVHMETTAEEIIEDFPGGVQYLFAGVGTGGHLTGCGEVLREKFKEIKIYAIEPELSPVLSGGKPSPHPLQGIGAGFIPKVLNQSIYDEVVTVSKDDAFRFARLLPMTEGLSAGISTAANLVAIDLKSEEIKNGSTVLTFAYDSGERYLSVENLFN